MSNVNLLLLYSNTWSYLTVCEKISPGSFKKCYLQNVFINPIYSIYVYKEDLALNNLHWLICHKTQPNQILYI